MRRPNTIFALIYLLQHIYSVYHLSTHPFVQAFEEDNELLFEGSSYNDASAETTGTAGAASQTTWSHLQHKLPMPLSDMAVSLLTFTGFESSNKLIVLTGGCNHPNGNVLTTINLRHFGIDNCFENCIIETFQCTSVSNKIFAFKPSQSSSGEWGGSFVELTDMPRKRARHASAVIVVNGKHLLCVLGGRDENDHLIGEIDCYDPVSNSWSTPASLPSALQSSDCTAVASSPEPYTPGKDETGNTDEMTATMLSKMHTTYTHNPTTIHLIGGYNKDYVALSTVTSIDFSNLSNVQFSSGPSLNTERGDVDSVILAHRNGEEFVYVSAGFSHLNDFNMPHNSVERIALRHLSSMATSSTTKGAWHEVGERDGEGVQERGDKQLVALNGVIYAFGGKTKVNPVGAISEDEILGLGDKSAIWDTVEVYVPGGGDDFHWFELDYMPVALHRFSASEWEMEGRKVVFTFGGQVGYNHDCKCFKTTDKVWVFEPEILERGTGGSEGSEGVMGGMVVVDLAKSGTNGRFCGKGIWAVHMVAAMVPGLFWLAM